MKLAEALILRATLQTRLEKLKGRLPADKSTPLIFYCGGFT